MSYKIQWKQTGRNWIGNFGNKEFLLTRTLHTCWHLYEVKEGELILLEPDLQSSETAKSIAEMYLPPSRRRVLVVLAAITVCVILEVIR
jgi:hypothetical protein